jgi:hypothetical protein
MSKQPRHRPKRVFENAKRLVIECDLSECPHCGQPLKARNTWHMRKTVQTLDGPLFIGGKTRECANPNCSHSGKHYYASRALMISLPKSTYGLDVLAYIGWQHEHEHKQLVEIQRELNQCGILINERNTGKLYRQFLAFLGEMSEATRKKLEITSAEHGGVIWAIDALQPEVDGVLLYVLYEVLSSTPVAATQLSQPTAEALMDWLQPYLVLPYPVLATLSDGERAIIEALRTCWPKAPHQRCQTHFLNNLVEPVLEYDVELRQRMRQDMGGLPKVPTNAGEPNGPDGPPF